MILISRWLSGRRREIGQPPSAAAASQATPAQARRSLVSASDFLVSLLLLRLLPVAARRPAASWPAEARGISGDILAVLRDRPGPLAVQLPSSLPMLSGMDAKQLGASLFSAYVLECIELVASSLGRYTPTGLRLEGASRLQDALAEGNGAVLWCERCFSSSLLLKATLASSGFELHQLSRPVHSFSSTRLGIRFLNAVSRKAEDRYLAERIIVDDGIELAASRRIMGLLRDNRLVSITVNKLGVPTVEAPLLDGVVRVATGAPHFAFRSGAPLLPVFSHRDGHDYVVEIGEPIRLAGMSRDSAYAFAVRELAGQLSDYIPRHPLDWAGWLGGTYSEPES